MKLKENVVGTIIKPKKITPESKNTTILSSFWGCGTVNTAHRLNSKHYKVGESVIYAKVKKMMLEIERVEEKIVVCRTFSIPRKTYKLQYSDIWKCPSNLVLNNDDFVQMVDSCDNTVYQIAQMIERQSENEYWVRLIKKSNNQDVGYYLAEDIVKII